jgi:hypothetical protein
MPVQFLPAIPLVLAILAIGLFAVVHAIWPSTYGYELLLRRRARWADARGFFSVNRIRATNRIASALPGLPGGEHVAALNAYEKDGCLVSDVTAIPGRSDDRHRKGAAAWQAMTVARAVIDYQFPVMEIRPWGAWPPDSRVISQRGLALSPGDGFASGKVPTVLTNDKEFDRMFVVRGKNKRAAIELLTPQVRRVLMECPNATFSMMPGSLLVTAPRLADDQELNRIVHLLLEGMRTALALRPYAA